MIDQALVNNRTLWDYDYNTKKLAILQFLYYGARNYEINMFTCAQIHQEVMINEKQQIARTYTALQRMVRFGLVKKLTTNLFRNDFYQIDKMGRHIYYELRDRREMRLTTGVNVSLWLKYYPPKPLPYLHKFVKERVHSGSNAATWRLPDDERLALYVPVRREFFEDKWYNIEDYFRCGGDVAPYQDLIDKHDFKLPFECMVEPITVGHQLVQDVI